MKIAILFRGQCTNPIIENKVWKKHFFDKFPDIEFDLFFHTWEIAKVDHKQHNFQDVNNKIDLNVWKNHNGKVQTIIDKDKILYEWIERIISLNRHNKDQLNLLESLSKQTFAQSLALKPLFSTVLKKTRLDENNFSWNVMRLASTLGQIYSTSKVIELYRSFEQEYDFVVITRPDVLWLDVTKFDFLQIQKKIQQIANREERVWFWENQKQMKMKGSSLRPWEKALTPNVRVVDKKPYVKDSIFICNSDSAKKFPTIKELTSMLTTSEILPLLLSTHAGHHYYPAVWPIDFETVCFGSNPFILIDKIPLDDNLENITKYSRENYIYPTGKKRHETYRHYTDPPYNKQSPILLKDVIEFTDKVKNE